MAAGGGGAWKVAYADFVTAMMAFFLVMWITAQSQKIKEAIAHHFSDPFGLEDRNGKSGGIDSSGPSINFNENQRFSVKPKLLVEQSNRSHQVGTMVFFKSNSVALDEQAKASIESLVPNLMSQSKGIEIIGFTDPKALESGGESAWVQSHQRCLAVKEFLEAWGVPMHKIRLVQGVADVDLTSGDSLRPPSLTQPNRVEVRVQKPDAEE